jgi:hypothetical protein
LQFGCGPALAIFQSNIDGSEVIPSKIKTMGILIDKYPVPDVSFSIEYEFEFIVLKSLHKAFEESGDKVPVSQAISESPTTSEKGKGKATDDEGGPTDIGVVVGDDIQVVHDASISGDSGSAGKEKEKESDSHSSSSENQEKQKVSQWLPGLKDPGSHFAKLSSHSGSSQHNDNGKADQNSGSVQDNDDGGDDDDDDDDESSEDLASWKSPTQIRKEKRRESKDSSDSGCGGPSEKTVTTRNSLGADSYQSIHRYVCALLNHKLPHSPAISSLIAPVQWAPLDKASSSKRWHVTQDITVTPTRRTFALYQDLEAAKAAAVEPPERSDRAFLRRGDRLEREAKKMWRVAGVELVSSVLQFNEDWFPKW